MFAIKAVRNATFGWMLKPSAAEVEKMAKEKEELVAKLSKQVAREERKALQKALKAARESVELCDPVEVRKMNERVLQLVKLAEGSRAVFYNIAASWNLWCINGAPKTSAVNMARGWQSNKEEVEQILEKVQKMNPQTYPAAESIRAAATKAYQVLTMEDWVITAKRILEDAKVAEKAKEDERVALEELQDLKERMDSLQALMLSQHAAVKGHVEQRKGCRDRKRRILSAVMETTESEDPATSC